MINHEFWKRFNVYDPKDQKVLRLYEVKHIDDPCYVTLAVNPKEYFEYFKSESINKKHKGIKKGSNGMMLLLYILRIRFISHHVNLCHSLLLF